MNGLHLTDEQFTAMLTGDSNSDLRAHLAGCADCRLEVEKVGAAIESFNEKSLLWAAATAPRRVPVPSPWKVRYHSIPRWSMAAAALLVIGTAIGVHQERKAGTEPETAAVAFAAPPASNVLADDNRLMISIDDELAADVRPQVPVSDLRVAEERSVDRAPRKFEN